jgi:hypothetical protein
MPVRGHDSADAMGIRSQQQVSNFVSENVPEHGVAESSLFCDSLDGIVENVGVVACTFLIHESRTEHIVAIASLSTNRARKDLHRQVSGIHAITITGLDFLRFRKASLPDRFNSRLSKNPPGILLRSYQQLRGNIGVVIHGDRKCRPFGALPREFGSTQERCHYKHHTCGRFKYSAHGVTSSVTPTLPIASNYLNALEITS